MLKLLEITLLIRLAMQILLDMTSPMSPQRTLSGLSPFVEKTYCQPRSQLLQISTLSGPPNNRISNFMKD